MAKTPAQTLLDTGSDSSLSTLYPATLQSIPSVAGNSTIYITNKEEFITNIITENGAGGADNEIQFNIGGRSAGDSGLTYDAETDSLTVANAIQVGSLKTDHILYANGNPWDMGTNYGNSNVAVYLDSGTYTGNFTVNNFSATTYAGNGQGLTHINSSNIVGSVANAVYAEAAGAASSINAANVVGTVANATYATSAGTAGSASTAQTVTQAAQTNITSVGTLTSLNVTNRVTAALFQGSGANLSDIPAANITGTITSATTAGTVTTAAQPNITSVGTLSGLSVTSTITGNISGSAATAGTVTTAAQPNITSTGTLTSATVGSSAPIYLYANGLANVTSTTASTNTTSGALKVAGGLGVQGNIHAGMIESTGNLSGLLGLFGDNAQGTTFTNPVIIAKSTGTDYIQAAIINSTDTGSSDFTAYGDNGDEGTAWVDMGFTGSNFADANYTITGSNDGYLFAQGSGGLGGNLVLATGNLGYSVHRDIVFATGGFLTENERMRLNHETLSLDISTQQNAISTTSGSFRVDGGAGITGNVYVGGKVDANTITLSGTGTAVNAGSGNILTNQVTGTQFNFLNGGFTASLTASGGATANYTLTLPADAGTNGQVLTTNGSGVLSWSSASGGSYGDSNVATLLGSFGSNNIVTTGNIQAKNIRANASHANLVFGDATSSSGPGMSSTDTMAIVTNRGTSDKAWYFNTDGSLSVPGSIIPSANISYDLGSDNLRFRDLYLAGTTIDLGGTLIQAEANGQVSIGNATFSSSGGITMGIASVSSNTVASSSHVGKLVTYDPGSTDGILYEVPNIATAGFAVGSRIELFVGTMANITVAPASGSGVTIQKAKPMDATFVTANTWIFANTCMGKLTMIASDSWILSA